MKDKDISHKKSKSFGTSLKGGETTKTKDSAKLKKKTKEIDNDGGRMKNFLLTELDENPVKRSEKLSARYTFR